MKNFPIMHEGKEYWIARNVAVVCVVFTRINNVWCVLANQRGSGAADFQGLWNAPCGYLDWDETTSQAAIREVYEETGVKIPSVKCLGFDDNPNSNLQNITFRYYSIIDNPTPEMLNLCVKDRGGEQDEVASVAWIPLYKIDEFQWAFNHDILIKKCMWINES